MANKKINLIIKKSLLSLILTTLLSASVSAVSISAMTMDDAGEDSTVDTVIDTAEDEEADEAVDETVNEAPAESPSDDAVLVQSADDIVNPDSADVSATATVVYSSLDEGIQALRTKLVNRDSENGNFYVYTEPDNTIYDIPDYMRWFESEVFDIYRERAGMLPVEGDYLYSSRGNRQNPTFFSEMCIEPTYVRYKGNDIYVYKLLVTTEFITTRAEEQAVDAYVASLFENNASLRNAKASNSNETKAKAAYDWTVSNVRSATGDRTRAIVHTAYNAFVGDHQGTCEAYALVYQRLCREMGVPVKMIMGTDAGAHTYTITKMDDGYYYYVDPNQKIFKRAYNQFSKAPEQAIYSTSEFIQNYMRKIKNYPGSNYNPAEDGNKCQAEMSLTLKDEVTMNLYLTGFGDARYARIKCGSDTQDFPISGSSAQVSYKMPQTKLNLPVQLTLLDSSKTAVNMAPGYELKSYSIQSYYDSVKKQASPDPKLVRLLECLINYGYATDNFFNGANNTISTEAISGITKYNVRDYARTITNNGGGVQYVGHTLTLKSKTALNVYFK